MTVNEGGVAISASPAARLRLGLALWLVSWLPVAQLVGARQAARLAIWGVQIAIGLVGIALAGSTFVASVKSVGWRRAPGVLWHAFLRGDASVAG